MNEFFWSEIENNQWKRCTKNKLGRIFPRWVRVFENSYVLVEDVPLAMRSRLGWVDVGLMVDVHS